MDGHDDHWAVLGLDAGADRAAVRRAHRALVQATHPDHGGDADAFRRVQLAFEAVLPLAPAPVVAAAPRDDPYRGFLAALDAAARMPVAPAPAAARPVRITPAPPPSSVVRPSASAARFAAVLADALAA